MSNVTHVMHCDYCQAMVPVGELSFAPSDAAARDHASCAGCDREASSVDPRYCLHSVDGEDMALTLREFFAYNVDLLRTDAEEAIRALEVGETYCDGGGASPVWSLTRLS